MSLSLETPKSFSSFPFLPYDIQLSLMQHLYESIETRRVTVVESPTGTVIHSVFCPKTRNDAYYVGQNAKPIVCLAHMAS